MSTNFFKTGLSLLAATGMLCVQWPLPARAVALSGAVPSVVSGLTPQTHLAGTNVLHLSLSLPLRNQTALNSLLAQIYNPASTNYHKFLTPDQFTAQFAPATNDFQSLLAFARSNGFSILTAPSNRMLIEVSARATDVEKAFNTTLNVYQHPTENRTFYAPANTPSVADSLPLLEVGGLNSYVRPHPKLRLAAQNKANLPVPKLGSGPYGSYMGNDFRAAYVPGTALTGSGQTVALVQFDGYYASDIALYEQKAGLSSVSLTNILLNGFSGTPTGNGGEIEVSLDIEMVISMAPGVNQVRVYEGDPYNFIPNVVLNQIAMDNAARQVSCSWGWTGGPNATSDQIFLQMALQGQTFYNASGDDDAFLPGQVDNPGYTGFPSSDPYITQVGGTTLTTSGPGGAWVSEKVWNWGGGSGTSGGVSSYYTIPSWQSWINMSTNHGSTTYRNIPDVALTGDNVYVIADNGIDYPGTGGTSCAAPLWAGFTALVNQQAASNGHSSVGFINPAIYSLAQAAAYASQFNDITNGNNTWSSSPTNYFAVPGYDLCTGLGTPKGTNLINALAGGTFISTPVITPPTGTSFGTTLSVMNGSNPNGSWYLFVQDDQADNTGILNGGWLLSLTTANPVGYAADNQTYSTPTNLPIGLNTHWNVAVAVTNYGPSISTNVYITDTLPAGLGQPQATSSIGTVTFYGSTLVWNLGTLAVTNGGTLNLSFSASTTGTFTNTATVSSSTTDPNPDDDTATSVVTVAAPSQQPVLSPVLLPHAGGFQLTVTGDGLFTTLQSSTNLVNWVTIASGIPPFTITDTNNYPSCFYRAIVGP
jgi:subtilase family serine protease